MAQTLQLPPGVTQAYGKSGTLYVPDVNGRITVQSGDIVPLLDASLTGSQLVNQWYSTPTAPAVANATAQVASITMSNATLTVAAQPDISRPLQFKMGAGTTPITAGVLTVSYTANDGSAQVDSFSLVSAAGGAATTVTSTFNTTKGVSHLNSPVISGLVGGTSPFVYGGTTAVLALPCPMGASGFAITKENLDGADVATPGAVAANGLWTPGTAPNATHLYSVGYSFFGA